MELLFRNAGYSVVKFNEIADVYLVNTCVVTNEGQRKSRQMINRAVRKNPDAVVVVTGCYPQTAPEEVATIPGVDVVIGNRERAKVVELTEQALTGKKQKRIDAVKQFDNNVQFDELATGRMAEHTRAFLKIQEGCNQFCTYCIIPYARGRLRSRSLAGIKEEVAKLVADGYREIVLIGIHLGCYGKETGDRTLFDAVQAALSVPGLERLRLGSLESVEVDDELLDLMVADKRFCRHLHLPLQSGCDKVLQAMHRPYNTAKFADLLVKIRNKVSDIAITTDVIVGFPGETDADFEQTMQFVQKMGFAKMHIFPYSKRCGTPAASYAEQITEQVKAERAEQLAQIDAKLQQQFLQTMVGKNEEVLFEQETVEGFIDGHSGNYQLVRCRGDANLSNQLAEVEIIGIEQDVLIGRIDKFIKKEKKDE